MLSSKRRCIFPLFHQNRPFFANHILVCNLQRLIHRRLLLYPCLAASSEPRRLLRPWSGFLLHSHRRGCPAMVHQAALFRQRSGNRRFRIRWSHLRLGSQCNDLKSRSGVGIPHPGHHLLRCERQRLSDHEGPQQGRGSQAHSLP